ncbi:hypothetical protein [Streptosporangium canum]|uniref:hypothetical protein n=1 Tax=Streptosporangium canum TaxID=324952 RepID=UPI003787A3E5
MSSNTANPHMFINHATATGVAQTTCKWVNKALRFRAQELREDRILDEARASAGDVRRVCDMFGLTVKEHFATSRHLVIPTCRSKPRTPVEKVSIPLNDLR